MKDESPIQRPAARVPEKKAASTITTTVALAPEVHAMLSRTAPKFKLAKKDYANAAIRYFVENGLDPTKTTTLAEGIKTRAEISEASHTIRKLTAEVGNQLTGALSSLEGEMHSLMEAQQRNFVSCLEQVQGNILAHQVAVEEQLVVPILQYILHSNGNARLTRLIADQLLLKLKAQSHSSEEFQAVNEQFNAHVRKDVALTLAELNVLPRPKPTTTITPYVPVIPDNLISE